MKFLHNSVIAEKIEAKSANFWQKNCSNSLCSDPILKISFLCEPLHHTSDLGSFSIAGLQCYQINYSLHQTLHWRFQFKKIIFSGHFRHNLTISTLVSSGNAAVLHFLYLSTNMVVASCMLNIQTCMIYHVNQNFSADAKMYHTFLYVEHT